MELDIGGMASSVHAVDGLWGNSGNELGTWPLTQFRDSFR